MKNKIILIGIISLFTLFSVNAQVTVGSGVEPREGTLLDIKENANSNKAANSGKGFGLPRVKLESLSTFKLSGNPDDHVGLTVYNTNKNNDVSEGTYCWFNGEWNQVVLVDNAGANGNFLMSNGANTYSWTNITIPTYKFSKPTQRASFNAENAITNSKTYLYSDITKNKNNTSNTYWPDDGFFTNDFVYTETLNIKSGAAAEKYILLELTANINKITINNAAVEMGFWEKMQIEVLIGNKVAKTYERTLSTPTKSVANSTIALFSIIPLTSLNLAKNTYDLKIRISNITNFYPRNAGSSTGRFMTDKVNFLEIALTNFGFILYEEE